MADDILKDVLEFVYSIEKLKHTTRYSSSKNELVESVAEHSWRVAIMTMVVAEDLRLDIDIHHATRIALIHDISEYLHGDVEHDLVRQGKITKEEKKRMDGEGIIAVTKTLPDSIKSEILGLYEEYETKNSKEAKFVSAIDKLEALTHMTSSGHKNIRGKDPNYADKAVSEFPELSGFLEKIKSDLKKEYDLGGIPWEKYY